MQYKELGNTGIQVSKIGVGTLQFGRPDIWGPVDIKECQKIVSYAIDAGVNLFDTAKGYGSSEEILGDILKEKREKILLCTKASGTNYDYPIIKKMIEASLKKLKTDYVDLYQIHWPKVKHRGGMEKKDYENIFTSMNRLKQEGLIRFAGISNFRLHNIKEFNKEALDFIVSDQVPYSLLWRFYDVEGVTDFCKSKNISFLAYSPLAQGLLTGRFSKDTGKPAEKMRQRNILFNEPVYGGALKVVEVVREIAEQIGATPAQVALKWTMERDIVVSCLCGGRRLKHFEDNIKSVDVQLIPEQLERLNEISIEFQKKFPPGLELWIGDSRKEDVEKLGVISHSN